jgi:hypothetical protein
MSRYRLLYSTLQDKALLFLWYASVKEVYASLIIRSFSSRHLVGSFDLLCACQREVRSRGIGNRQEDGDHTLTDKLHTFAKSEIKYRRIRKGNNSKDYIILTLSAPCFVEETESKDYSFEHPTGPAYESGVLLHSVEVTGEW